MNGGPDGVPDDGIGVRRLDAADALGAVPALARLLVDCVEGGASVSFMLPITVEKAHAFWRTIADGVARGDRVLLVAENAEERIVGTVQLLLALPENQPHRADVAKMLVSPSARRRGIAEQLLHAVEVEAVREGRTLLVLDTVTGSSADRLYTRNGWQRVGEIPDYALMPNGERCPTTIFYKALTQG
ncbi:MAG: GNAT family N-acetyltransferase [bacterium]